MEENMIIKSSNKSAGEIAIDTILADEEMKRTIRKLVEATYAKGLRVTHLNNATKEIWNDYLDEIHPEEANKYVVIGEEQAFFKKIDDFWKKFGKEILEYDKSVSAEEYLTFLKTMYLVFKREEHFTRALLEKYDRIFFNSYPPHLINNNTLNMLFGFYGHSYFKIEILDDGTEIPLLDFSSRYNSKHLNISNHPDFKEFSSNYKIRHASHSESAIGAIWLINKFF